MANSSGTLKKNRGIWLVGTIHEGGITGSKLPSNRQVLGRFFHFHKNQKNTIRNSATATSMEIQKFWDRARIPTVTKQRIIEKIEKLMFKWQGLKKSISKRTTAQQETEARFVDVLDDLFDIASVDAMSQMTITEDKEFLYAQREKGRRGCMGVVDTKLYRQEKNRAARVEEAENRKRKEINRQQELNDGVTSACTSDANESSSESNSDEDFVTTESLESCAKLSKKIKISSNILTPALTSALDRTKTSDRNATYILAAAAGALGDKTQVPSRETIRKKRRQNREEIATEVRLSFAPDVPLTIHWDGKMLPALTSKQKVDRLAVLVSGCGVMKLLGVPQLSDGTGKKQAEAVHALAEEWNIVDRVKFMSFDTTASNTGVFNGACTILEGMFGRELLSLACRHHILELIVAAVFTKLFGPSSGPNIKLFERFASSWGEINKKCYESGLKDITIAAKLEPIKNNMVEFIRDQISQFQPRHDYNELLSLALMFLGAEPAECGQIHPPGACHRARWMAKIIYSLKIYLLRSQFRLTVGELSNLREINLFVITVRKQFILEVNYYKL